MIRRTVWAALLVTLACLLPLSALAHGAAADGPTVIYQATFANLAMSGRFDELLVVLDFAPGAGVPLHVHGGPTLVTVLEGAITLRERGKEKSYKAGESWTEMPGQVHEASNAGSARASVVVTFLLPKGAEPTTIQAPGTQSAPGPTLRYQAMFPALTMADQFDELLVVLEFAPGAGVPAHVHGGPTLVTVLEGTITLRENGVATTYRAGESWTETPGRVHDAANAGSVNARVAATFLLPPGAEATTLVTPGLPNTGAGGAGRRDMLVWLAIATVLATGALMGLLRRRATRRRFA